MRDYYEDLWERLPKVLVAPDLEIRAAFLLGHVRAGQQILDLGCGDGSFSELICERHPDVVVTAADVAEAALERARSRPRLPETVACVLVPFDGELPFSDNRFDLVWASEVIEHVADTGRWLSEVRRVLNPGGTLLVTTPNHSRLALASRGIGAFSPPLGDHLHLYDRSSLDELLGEFGFDPVRVRVHRRWSRLEGLLLAEAER